MNRHILKENGLNNVRIEIHFYPIDEGPGGNDQQEYEFVFADAVSAWFTREGLAELKDLIDRILIVEPDTRP